eukprot:gene36920-22642_t
MYDLDRKLGGGTYGTVKVGIDASTGREYAVKAVPVLKGREDAQLREIAAMKGLSHANVVLVVDSMQAGDKLYVVMELFKGGDLLSKLASDRRFDEPRARSYFRQLIYGIEYLHDNAGAHGNLKLENLLLDDSGRLKISDWGFSRMMGGRAITGACV